MEDQSTELLETLASPETRDRLLDLRTRVRNHHELLLLEAAEFKLKLAKQEAVDPERKTQLNTLLDICDSSLTLLRLAIRKQEFLEQLLLPPDQVQGTLRNQLAELNLVEELMFFETRKQLRWKTQNPDFVVVLPVLELEKTLKPFLLVNLGRPSEAQN
jgi:hypothetical protein